MHVFSCRPAHRKTSCHGRPLPFAVAPTPVGSVGRAVTRCVLGQRVCWEAFGGNTMLQAGLDGAPMFLHANLPPKWTLELAADPAARARRWAVVQPGGGDFAALAKALA